MKHSALALLLTFSLIGNAQIGKMRAYEKPTELGKVERYIGNLYALYTLSYKELDSITNSYVLTFTNEQTLYDKNKTLDTRVLRFTATQEEFDYLYSFLEEGFKQVQNRSLEVGQDLVKTTKTSSKYLYIYVDYKNGESASFRVSKRELAKLFGK